VFHFAVLAGIAFHWSFIYRIAGGGLPATKATGSGDI
jgi:hypothetical protein